MTDHGWQEEGCSRRGPAMANALSPSDVVVRGMSSQRVNCTQNNFRLEASGDGILRQNSSQPHRVTLNHPKWPWHWSVTLTCKFLRYFSPVYTQLPSRYQISASFQLILRAHTHTQHVFMIIRWQSSQMWEIIEASDRHGQLKTILPRSYDCSVQQLLIDC